MITKVIIEFNGQIELPAVYTRGDSTKRKMELQTAMMDHLRITARSMGATNSNYKVEIKEEWAMNTAEALKNMKQAKAIYIQISRTERWARVYKKEFIEDIENSYFSGHEPVESADLDVQGYCWVTMALY